MVGRRTGGKSSYRANTFQVTERLWAGTFNPAAGSSFVFSYIQFTLAGISGAFSTVSTSQGFKNLCTMYQYYKVKGLKVTFRPQCTANTVYYNPDLATPAAVQLSIPQLLTFTDPGSIMKEGGDVEATINDWMKHPRVKFHRGDRTVSAFLRPHVWSFSRLNADTSGYANTNLDLGCKWQVTTTDGTTLNTMNWGWVAFASNIGGSDFNVQAWDVYVTAYVAFKDRNL